MELYEEGCFMLSLFFLYYFRFTIQNALFVLQDFRLTIQKSLFVLYNFRVAIQKSVCTTIGSRVAALERSFGIGICLAGDMRRKNEDSI